MCLTEFDEEKFVRTMKAEGFKEGVEQNKIETAKAMLKDNFSFDKIAQYTGLSVDEIAALAEQIEIRRICSKYSAEVRNVCLTDFDEAKFVRSIKAESTVEIAKAMLKEHLAVELIEKYTGLSSSEIQALTE